MSTVKNKPFLKWAGGKTQLLSVLEENLPENIKRSKTFETYVEPFVGAGAFFIYLASNYEFDRIIINDLNYKLINVYKVIKSNCEELIDKLSKMREEYLQYDGEQQKEMYLNFIFINKTCFNGLYRENQKGGYNVPWGQQKNPSMYDEEQIRSMSKLLNKKENGREKIVILNGDYRKVQDYIDDKALVYIDPPYRPVTKGGFNSYNKSGFNDDAQREPSEFYRDINSKGAKVMLSNSDPKNLDDNDEFFDNLYEGFNIQRVSASRMINSNGKGRGNITEILVRNYK
nr:Dam family site-specific DNA-(adenine-N6)-methyltransferase [uncultured Romboutsia sp.]